MSTTSTSSATNSAQPPRQPQPASAVGGAVAKSPGVAMGVRAVAVVPSAATTTNPMAPTSSATTVAANVGTLIYNNTPYRYPIKRTIESAMRLAINDERPIMMDYWTDSLDKKVIIGVNSKKEKYLVKSMDEYTSMIVKLWNIDNQDLIVVTENSIYLVANSVKVSKIELPTHPDDGVDV